MWPIPNASEFMSKIKTSTHTDAEQQTLTRRYTTTQSESAVCMAKGLKERLQAMLLRSINPRPCGIICSYSFSPMVLIFKCRGVPIVCSSLITVAFDYEKFNSKDSTLRAWQRGSLPISDMCQNTLHSANYDYNWH